MLGRGRIAVGADPPAAPEDEGTPGAPGALWCEVPYAWVNRYPVESAESDLDLRAFFPGAHVVVIGREAAAAG